MMKIEIKNGKKVVVISSPFVGIFSIDIDELPVTKRKNSVQYKEVCQWVAMHGTRKQIDILGA